MTDQPTTPLNDILRNAGMPEDAAASIAGQYGELRMARHFEIPTVQFRPIYTGEDD